MLHARMRSTHLFLAFHLPMFGGFDGLLLFLLQPDPNLPLVLQVGAEVVEARLLQNKSERFGNKRQIGENEQRQVD